MNKIEELKVAASVNGYPPGAIVEKLNEVIRTVNGLKCVEEEQPIYAILAPSDVLIISKSEEGLLVAANDGNGRVVLERVPWPKDVKKTEMAGLKIVKVDLGEGGITQKGEEG